MAGQICDVNWYDIQRCIFYGLFLSMDLAYTILVLSHTINETFYKLLRVSMNVTRCTDLRPLLTSTFALQKKKFVASRILFFVFNETRR